MDHVQCMMSLERIKPNPRNTRTHSKRQIHQIAKIIQAVGFAAPVLVDENGVLLAGHARIEAAKLLNLREVPAVVLHGLSDAKKRALLFADNRLAEDGRWDRAQLAVELPDLAELLILEGLDIDVTGFAPVEIDQIAHDFEVDSTDPADDFELPNGTQPISQSGDLWEMGPHRLLCGNALREPDLRQLMGNELAEAAILDPPFNLDVRSIGGRGRTQHNQFRMASGEMSDAEFVKFLAGALDVAARFSRNGSVHYVFIDWRHVDQLIKAGNQVYDEFLNLIVWVKSNAGQGSFYRSQHELIGVFRTGNTQHLNNVELGRHGRSRSNVWQYAGANTFRAGRLDDLRDHPTVKPVSLVADAIKDCTRRGGIVLDTFAGAGTTILAADRVGRQARAIEIEPNYVDVAIRRWQKFTGKDAVHVGDQQTFDEMATRRLPPAKASAGRRSRRAGR